jgi:hypothetical protein
MKAIKPVAPVHGRMVEQIPAFAAIGPHWLFRRRRDHLCLRQICRPAAGARPAPGFIIATIVNFALNRAITFRHSRAPVFRAFLRYCGVASVGLAVNYSVYSACVLLAPAWGSPSRPRSCRCSSPPAAVWRWF